MRKQLSLYSDRRYLRPPGRPHVALLYPFWGKNPENPADPLSGRFDAYLAAGHRFFEPGPFKDAELAVWPSEWEKGSLPLAHELARQASDAGKPFVIFFNSDSEERIPVPGSFIFRTSFRRSTRQPTEFAMPAWSEDFVERYLDGQVPIREKGARPVVGYCGFAFSQRALRSEPAAGLLRRGRGAARVLARLDLGTRGHRGTHLRTQAVWALAGSPQVETNFLLRKALFWNGAVQGGVMDFGAAQRSRREFVDNMVGSDYVLCLRGGGNFSYRLYETLSCGRIPVFVDTDCVLPYEGWIDWRAHCVWVPEGDIPRIAERVAAFHAALSPAEFRDLQRRCRALWEDWLSPTGFFANFYRHFDHGRTAEGGGSCAS